MIQVRGLRYSYHAKSVMFFPDVRVEAGSSLLLLGESGSGKTTLLHLIGGLLRAQQGHITINGTDISNLAEHRLDEFRGKHIGFIFQKNHLLSSLSVRQNLLMAPYLSQSKQDHGKVVRILEELGLSEKIDSRIAELSHGQAQRIAIARALINDPLVILADEPTSALDDKNCTRVIELLLSLARMHGSTLLIATHDQRLKNRVDNCINLDSITQRMS